MAEITADVREIEAGEWIVDLPLGDKESFKSREQAQAFANAFRLSITPKPSALALKNALDELQRKDLHNCMLARRIHTKLVEVGEKESSW